MDTAPKPIARVRAGKEGRGRAPSVGSPTELKIKVSRGACAATIVNVLTSLVDSKRDLMLELFYADEVPKDPHCAPAADISGGMKKGCDACLVGMCNVCTHIVCTFFARVP